jgi:hypothetical protein
MSLAANLNIDAITAANAVATAAVSGTPPVTPVQSPLGAAAPAAVPVTAPAVPVAAAVQPVFPAEHLAALTTLQAKVAEFEAAEQRRSAEAAEAAVNALKAKGEIKQAFELQREQARLEIESAQKKLKESEDRARRFALDGELARNLAAQPLVAGGAEQLTQLWRSHFTVEAQGDSLAVQAPGFQPVGAWIAAQLGRPEYAHFLRPQNPHGGTAGGPPGTQGVPTAPAQAAQAAGPANLSEAVLLTMAAIEKSKADPRLTPSLGFGLRGAVRTG